MKVTNLDLHTRIRELKQDVHNINKKLDGFEGFDPRDDIKTNKSFEMLWYYNETYYDNPSDLFDIAAAQGYPLKKQSWKSMLKDPNKQKQYHPYKINLVYVSWVNDTHGITTNGDIIKRNSLNKTKKEGNRAPIYINGERKLFNVGVQVYREFIDGSFDGVKVHHKNGNITDCRIDNIELYE